MNVSPRIGFLMSSFALLLAASGCSHKSPEEIAQQLQSQVNQIIMTANNTLGQGRANEALASLDAAYTNSTFAPHRAQLLSAQLQLLLQCNRPADARSRALAASTDPALASGACEMLYRFYQASGDANNAVTWSSDLINHKGTVNAMRLQAYNWCIADLVALHRDDQLPSLITSAIQTLPAPGDSMTLIRNSLNTLLSAGQLNTIEPVLAAATALKDNAAEVKQVSTATRVRAAAIGNNWAALVQQMTPAIEILPDADLEALLRAVFASTANARQLSVENQCAELVIFNASTNAKPFAVATAARKWTANTMASNKSALPSRLTAMLNTRQVSVALITEFYVQHYYAFVNQPEQLQQLLVLGDRLVPLVKEDDTRNDIKLRLLESCFLTQDYDRALALLAARIPGDERTEEWHLTAIAKIKAHQALKQNQPRAAVQHFREFMDMLQKSPEPLISDPETGLRFPKEMVLGRNAKRIGDILKGIPDAVAAPRAFEEARGLYEQALKKSNDAEAAKIIRAELAQLPAAGAAAKE